MRFFHYTARDSRNQNVQGTMQAASEQEAIQALSKFGLQSVSVEELQNPANAPMPPNLIQPQTSAPPRVSQSAPGTASPYNYNKPAVAPSSTLAPQAVVHTVAGTDKQRFFLFSQLSSALRVGINPAQAFHEIAMRSANQFRPSLEEAAAASTSGKAISDVFARYPDLYPSDVVGIVRAGETAGFLPEALDEVARQAESAHSFRRWFFWIWFLWVNFIVTIPATIIVARGLVDMAKHQSDIGGSPNASSAVNDFLSQMWHETLWPWGPVTLVTVGIIWALWRYYNSRLAIDFRHKVSLNVPVYGRRARHENLARFSWTMSRVSRAGIAPNRAWQLAADSVPNRAFRDELVSMGQNMRENTKMADMVHRSPLFPDEFAPMIATAEYTGDLPGALDRLSSLSQGEFMAAQNYAKVRSGCWMLLGCFVTSGIAAIIFFYAWYHDVPDAVLGPDNPLR